MIRRHFLILMIAMLPLVFGWRTAVSWAATDDGPPPRWGEFRVPIDFDHADDIERLVLKITLESSVPQTQATLVIEDDGNVFYEEQSTEPGAGPSMEFGTITLEQHQDLVSLINEKRVWTFKHRYGEAGAPDAVEYVLTILMRKVERGYLYGDNESFTTRCRGVCPDDIQVVIDQIQDLTGKRLVHVAEPL